MLAFPFSILPRGIGVRVLLAHIRDVEHGAEVCKVVGKGEGVVMLDDVGETCFMPDSHGRVKGVDGAVREDWNDPYKACKRAGDCEGTNVATVGGGRNLQVVQDVREVWGARVVYVVEA